MSTPRRKQTSTTICTKRVRLTPPTEQTRIKRVRLQPVPEPPSRRKQVIAAAASDGFAAALALGKALGVKENSIRRWCVNYIPKKIKRVRITDLAPTKEETVKHSRAELGMNANQLAETIRDFRKKYPKMADLTDSEIESIVLLVVWGKGVPAQYLPDPAPEREVTRSFCDPKFKKWLDQYPPGVMPPIPDFLKRKVKTCLPRRRVA